VSAHSRPRHAKASTPPRRVAKPAVRTSGTKGSGAPTSAARKPAVRKPLAKPATRPAARPAAKADRRPSTGSASSAKRPTGTKAPTTSGPAGPARRRARRSRRVPLAVAAVVALAIVGTSFPASALLTQHHQLASANAQLAKVQHQNALLAEQEKQLNDKTEIQRLARQEYQLVLPGQSLFNVLPADGQPVATGGGTTSLGDPGSQPLVSPSNAPDMTPDPGNPTTSATGASSGSSPTTTTPASSSSSTGGSFWHRVTSTLEFWK
jgi:cell division protein FtsB